MPSRWTTPIGVAALAIYVALLTVGQSLHDHGVCSADSSHHGGCSHAAHASYAHDRNYPIRGVGLEDAQPDPSLPASDAMIEGTDTCLLCRFLSQKPLPVPTVTVVASSPLVSDVKPMRPRYAPHRPHRNFDVRGSPEVV